MQHHVAIMRKSWGFIPKIVSREKVIESRWYLNRSAPWGHIRAGDSVWFKNAGEPVTARAWVTRVLQFEDLTPTRVRALLRRYGGADGIAPRNVPEFYERFKNKRYCILVFLERAVRVTPFDVDKSEFGAMAAWMIIENIRRVAVKNTCVRQVY